MFISLQGLAHYEALQKFGTRLTGSLGLLLGFPAGHLDRGHKEGLPTFTTA